MIRREPSGSGLRRTKLVCTIGPASASRVDELAAAGMDVARINFSHGTPASRRAAVLAVRQVEATTGRLLAVMTDLSGPKIRLGQLAAGSVELAAGRRFMLRAGRSRGPAGDETGAAVSYERLATDVRVGDRVLLADGTVELRVTAVGDDVATEVVQGGVIRSRVGVAIPSERLSTPALTARDRADIPAVIELGADFIAQSFVRGPDDVRTLRALIGPDGPPIVAKIETRAAVGSFDAILEVADAVMIARGDLGVEMPYEEVPLIQKQLVRRALDLGVPSIVATQMLESMTNSPRPTRAEASDVANAVFDGADAIMLSGETAIGAHPVEAARVAARIARLVDVSGTGPLPAGMIRQASPDPDGGALAQAAAALAAADPSVHAIVCFTRTGRTARLLSAIRPGVPIVAFSPDPQVLRRLALAHGVVGRTSVAPADAPHRLEALAAMLRTEGLLSAGAAAVLIASSGEPGSAPDVLALHRVPATAD